MEKIFCVFSDLHLIKARSKWNSRLQRWTFCWNYRQCVHCNHSVRSLVLWQFFRLFWRLKPVSQSAVWMGKVWHSSKFKKIRNWILVKLVNDAPKSFHVVTGSPHSKRSVTWNTYLIQHSRQDVYHHLQFDSDTRANLHCVRVTDVAKKVKALNFLINKCFIHMNKQNAGCSIDH